MGELAFPAASGWRAVPPERVGFDADALARACNYAVASEIDWPEDASGMVAAADPPPFNAILGPAKRRGPASGVVVRDGLLAASWGDPARIDMAFSATKSYLATCVGLALDRGLIGSLDEVVAQRVDSPAFRGARNGRIRWRQLLQQTSEWSGTLFGIPDSVDHNRVAGGRQSAAKGIPRALHEPGTFWEYNDVRVNALAVAALHLWREPLPDVLRREVMGPIGASDGWRWHAYGNARIDVGGRRLASVPGGGHWGGGLWISALDHARFALLMLARGRWAAPGGRARRLLSENWIDQALAPCPRNPRYGCMWWLNTDGGNWPAASRRAFAAVGAGGNLVCVDPLRSLIVVTRWAGDAAGIVERVVAALRDARM